MQLLDLDTLVASQLPVNEGGVKVRSRRGTLCYDLEALNRKLQQRCVLSQVPRIMGT